MVDVLLKFLEGQRCAFGSQELAIANILVLLVIGLEEIFKFGDGNAFLMDSLQKVSSLYFVFKQDTHMVIVASHEKAMQVAEGGFAPQKDYIQVRGVVHEFRFGYYKFIPKVIIPFAYLLVGLHKHIYPQTGEVA